MFLAYLIAQSSFEAGKERGTGRGRVDNRSISRYVDINAVQKAL